MAIYVSTKVRKNGFLGTRKVWRVTATSTASPTTSDTAKFGVSIR